MSTSLDIARRVLEIESRTLKRLEDRLDGGFQSAVDLIFSCPGRTIVAGMGKSGIIGQKISATLASTGTPSYFLHPAEALHGDLGRLAAGDVLLALSHSGETEELLQILNAVKRLAIPLITLTGDPSSTLAKASDAVIDSSVAEEACPLGLAPTASTTAMLALGDALAMALLEKRGFSEEDYANLHPAGGLGLKLRRVEQLMHTGQDMPVVQEGAAITEVIYEMSRKGLGHAIVVDESARLRGIISDGDLRRFFEHQGNLSLERRAADCMTRSPVTITRRRLANEALEAMEASKITALPVVSADGKLEGVVHIHDLFER